MGQPFQPSHRFAGGLAVAGAAAFIVIVILLHWLQPGYDPRQQLMSELALGPHGGWMLPAFVSMAISLAAISYAIGPMRAAPLLRALLALASTFFLVAGVFPLGETSTEHIAAIAAAFVLAVLAMYLFPSLAGAAAALAGRPVSWSCAAGVAASVALGHSILPMGVGQRLAASFLLAWIVTVGSRLSRKTGMSRK